MRRAVADARFIVTSLSADADAPRDDANAPLAERLACVLDHAPCDVPCRANRSDGRPRGPRSDAADRPTEAETGAPLHSCTGTSSTSWAQGPASGSRPDSGDSPGQAPAAHRRLESIPPRVQRRAASTASTVVSLTAAELREPRDVLAWRVSCSRNGSRARRDRDPPSVRLPSRGRRRVPLVIGHFRIGLSGTDQRRDR